MITLQPNGNLIFEIDVKRCLLRVKSSIISFPKIGEIYLHALCQFQSSYRAPAKPFKPVLDKFEIDSDRKVLPMGEKK
jgi:hypothetical protein